MSTLICLGFGYSAQHHVAGFGARFDRIIGTSRDAGRAAELAARSFAGRRVEMLAFEASASDALRDAVRDADALLISAAPDEHGDPVLAALGEALAAAPRLRSVVLLSTMGVYGDRGGGWVDETAALEPVHERSRPRVAAEQAWQAFGRERGVAVAILRLVRHLRAGPERAGQRAARARAQRIDKPGQVFNRIHVEDIAQAIDAAFRAASRRRVQRHRRRADPAGRSDRASRPACSASRRRRRSPMRKRRRR